MYIFWTGFQYSFDLIKHVLEYCIIQLPPTLKFQMYNSCCNNVVNNANDFKTV